MLPGGKFRRKWGVRNRGRRELIWKITLALRKILRRYRAVRADEAVKVGSDAWEDWQTDPVNPGDRRPKAG